jgi:glycerophosphoryl diester phosphodiesterase
MAARFELQGHRGTRGLKPENTLPSFEIAFDLGVSAIETDLHLTRDGVVLIAHDPVVTSPLCRLAAGGDAPEPAPDLLVSRLTLTQLRHYRVDRNPDPQHFPDQDAGLTPLARLFAERHGIDPFTFPTLTDLFAFARAYEGALGTAAGKTPAQQAQVSRLRFDLELKRVPFQPEAIGDAFDGTTPGLLETRLVEVVRQARMVTRTTVRSFDHRCVRVLRQAEPGLTGAVVIVGTAPVEPAELARRADAQVYCPEYTFLDEVEVRQLHRAGIGVLPWTVNDLDDARKLLDWGVDGLTTDFPDRVASLLRSRGVNY